jgi:hypothetical protein
MGRHQLGGQVQALRAAGTPVRGRHGRRRRRGSPRARASGPRLGVERSREEEGGGGAANGFRPQGASELESARAQRRLQLRRAREVQRAPALRRGGLHVVPPVVDEDEVTG